MKEDFKLMNLKGTSDFYLKNKLLEIELLIP